MKSGFNLIGYATSPMGLGEDLRSFARLLEYLNINYSIIDLPTESQGKVFLPALNMLTQDDYKTSIFFMSPMECVKLYEQYQNIFTLGKVNIGYFLWELPDFPKKYDKALDLVDQIWCPTEFVKKSFYKNNKKLILSIPLPIIEYEQSKVNFRKLLNIPENAYVIFFSFDARSTMQRKNPMAVVGVFKKFLEVNPDSFLILKVNRSANMELDKIIHGVKNIKIIKNTITPEDNSALYQCANCYLSLHRSEGFGRTIVEALYHGLQIVTINYSGPNDYLNHRNAYLVKWTAVELREGEYPYATNSFWADPDEESAFYQLVCAWNDFKNKDFQRIDKNNFQFSVPFLAKKYEQIIRTYL